MNVAMMQPTFMPWQGFFELINCSDVFIFLDDFQFSVQSYHQRNSLFVNTGQVDWYTTPVGKCSFKAPLNGTIINESIPWRMKMSKRLQQNYSKSPYFKNIFPLIDDWLQTRFSSMAEQNISLILKICDVMKLKREFRVSSDFQSATQRSARVLELLYWCGAKRYYCARGSFPYMMEDGIFPSPDVEVLFQDFKPKPYRQVGSPGIFFPYLSILDGLLNIGPEKTFELVQSGTEHWNTWDEMHEAVVTKSGAEKEE
jgi:hypothetical protein